MWLHHTPYFLFATSSGSGHKSARVHVDVYTLIESGQANGSAILNHQRQLVVSTHCSQAPKILFFGMIGSIDSALVYPHIVIYDEALKRLECHRIEPSGTCEIAHIGLELGPVALCRVVSSTSIVLASTSRRGQLRGYDLFEWTPYQHRFLQRHLETDHIVGIAESSHGRPWSVFYYHPTKPNCVVISRGSFFQDQGSLPPTIHSDAIAPEYANNLRQIVTTSQYSRSLSDSNDPFTSIWAQTRSGELVFFQNSILQWSIAFPRHPMEMNLVECQSINCISKLCLIVHTGETTCLYDAKLGRLIKEWSTTKDDLIVADVRNMGLHSVLLLSDRDQSSSKDCTIYPASTLYESGISTALTEESVSKAKANLNNALGTLEQQLQLKRKRIERLQTSLVSKAEIIHDCRDVLSESLSPAFHTGCHLGTFSIPPQKECASFQRKRERRQKKVLERLIPVIGNTVSTSFQWDGKENTLVADLIEHVDQLETLECASGWITTTLGITIWFGVRLWNHSTQTIYNLRLSVAQQRSHGTVLTHMDPQTVAMVLGVVQLDPLTLDDNEYLDKSRAVRRLLANTTTLHFDRRQPLEGNTIMSHSTISIPKFPVLERCELPWRTHLAELVLISQIGCRLDSISGARLVPLMQDGLGLSANEDEGTFGSLEEGLIATVKQRTQSTSYKELQHESWDIEFKAQSEAVAVQMARKAVVICRRFD
ncbi:hypothetical protein BGX34_006475 [Mortierella sp. NVP85]|nr:hypothetical protein BGX34_006475 [Mortierella sp. NVP85]